jgi:carbon-monoxide dehydrogenase large subunit
MPFEECGQPLAATLADYLLPGAPEIPEIRVLHMETPSPYTSFGAKGIGEGGAVGPPAAIVSAVNDALQGMGIEVCNLPLWPQRILAEIEAGRAAQREKKPCAQSPKTTSGYRSSSAPDTTSSGC